MGKIVSVVTGGSGFVGSHLVDLLLEKGHRVKCLVRKTSDLKWLNNRDVEIYDCGLDRSAELDNVLSDADYLFHVAGVVKSKSDEGYVKGNVTTTENLLETLLKVNTNIKRIVVVSSQTAAGPSKISKPKKESSENKPITRYGKSKLQQEQLAEKYMNKLPITIVRPSAVYGERDTEIYLVFKTYKNGLMTLVGFNKKELTLIHVVDLVNGIYEASVSENTISKKYFLTSEKIYTWPEISNAMAKGFGKKAISIHLPHCLVYIVAVIAEFFALFSSKAATFNIEKARDFVQEAWTADVSLAKKDFEFSQKISLDDGMMRTILWYKDNNWL